MQQIEVQVIQGVGTYRELGNLQGRLHLHSKLEANHKKRRKRSSRNYHVNVQEAKAYYEHFAPFLSFQSRRPPPQGMRKAKPNE
ncbi:hypothetical protein [Bacillus sp. CGMCC 1.16541]|uniref:hypothetical protein n=1 Tax=Bacillus sp. CGMCC 1.16541 TaxID=2185143 RepID=UPI000D73A979|nr:hypothetical protein [Bacillus sp. CGMCC 1.16541]